MTGAHAYEVEIILGLLVVMAALVTVARKLGVPYPVLLVLGGLALALVPGLPTITLQPEIVFLIFLPPLLYWESLGLSYREFRANLKAIGMLAIALVLVTTCAVAVVAHAVIAGMTWPVAFILGAVLAPTDEVAVAEVAERIAIPRKAMAILEGESLINDAISLVAYRLAVAAAVTGTFSLGRAGLQFLAVGAGGVAIGLAVGWSVACVRRYRHDPSIEVTLSLLTAFAAYLPAEAVGASGVLSVVAAGLYLARHAPRLVSPSGRLQTFAVWQTVTFLLNGLLFILTGLQLKAILHSDASIPVVRVLGYTAWLILTMVVVRVVWVFGSIYLPRLLRPPTRRRPSWQPIFVIAATSVRGGISLVTALAVPFMLARGVPFPHRSLIISIAFWVILVTLTVQGLTLPWLVRRLRFQEDDSVAQEELRARLAAAKAALARLDALTKRNRDARRKYKGSHDSADALTAEMIQDLRDDYIERIHLLTARMQGKEDDIHETKTTEYRRLRHELIHAERDAVIRLRDEGAISDDVLRTIQRDLDLEELRLSGEDQE